MPAGRKKRVNPSLEELRSDLAELSGHDELELLASRLTELRKQAASDREPAVWSRVAAALGLPDESTTDAPDIG